MKDKHKARVPILAAGGIVLRGDRKPQVAIVQLRKPNSWVLPKGKLAASESAIAAARREVLEETGHRVSIHEFLGTLAYEASGRPKLVQFWRMQAIGGPVRELMNDVKAMQWLPLEDAIAQLTHVREQVFLEHVGPIALKSAERSGRRMISGERSSRKGQAEPVLPAIGTDIIEPAAALAPLDMAARFAVHLESDVTPIVGPDPAGQADAIDHSSGAPADLSSGTAAAANAPLPATLSLQRADSRGAGQPGNRKLVEKSKLVEKTWVWLRHVTQADRSRDD